MFSGFALETDVGSEALFTSQYLGFRVVGAVTTAAGRFTTLLWLPPANVGNDQTPTGRETAVQKYLIY